MVRLKVMTALGLIGALLGAGLATERSRELATFGLLLFVAGVVFLAAGIAGQAVVHALKDRDHQV